MRYGRTWNIYSSGDTGGGGGPSVGENVFFFVFIGTLTGVGGGVLRDIMAGETPYILVKHIYACAAIAGGIVCVVGRTAFGEAYGTILGLAATVLLRFLAAHFRWNLMRVS